ncbi:hypothetical protein F5Y17DRAFT_157491 [Xylariaceae sp. FL0594]|nr:hypothetical protein F5Y17DRAFT_157491 [Xylariaceae sp. FL0594]
MVAKSAKLDRIDIWRNEVASSQLCCVCSAPALRAKVFGAHGRSSPRVGVFTRTTSAAPTRSKHTNIECTIMPVNEPKKRPRPKFFSLGSGSDTIEHLLQSESSVCSICALPIDGVEYKILSSDGSGLVNDASRSRANSLKHLDAGGTAATAKHRPLLLKRISQVFRTTKKSGESLAIGSVPDTSKVTMTDRSHKTPGSCASTEMYHLLRREKRLEATVSKEAEEKTVGYLSEDSDKKPRIGIEQSAARLERAQRMLVRGGR